MSHDKWRPIILSLLKNPGYKCIHQGSICSRKGGIMIFFKESYSYDLRTSLRWRHNERNDVSITGVSAACTTVCSGGDQRKHQSSASLALVRGIHRWPVNTPLKGPVSRENVSIWWRHHVIQNLYIWEGLMIKVSEPNLNRPLTGDKIYRPPHDNNNEKISKSIVKISPIIDMQWNLSVASTSMMKFITCDLFSNVF